MAYALSLSGLLTTCRHHFVQRPHAQCNSIVYARVYVTFARQCNGTMYMRLLMAERRCSAHADVEQSDGGTLSARKPCDPLSISDADVEQSDGGTLTARKPRDPLSSYII